MLTANDLHGLYSIIPTPALAGATRIDAIDTVDLDATEELVNRLIDDGSRGIIALGTTGECATLSEADYRKFVAHLLSCVSGRACTFIGASCLGSQQVADRLRFLEAHGAQGVLLGPPMWQPVSTEMAVDFFRTISEAFPELAVMVYANKRAFRYEFPLEFWAQVATAAPSVIAAKHSRPSDLIALHHVTEGRINIVPNESTASSFAEVAPDTTTALWATAAAMGPAPVRALIEAINAHDRERSESITSDIREANAPVAPLFGDPTIFASYNIQLEKARINAAGYCTCGPCRPPYNHLPAEYERAAVECGERWRDLQARYAAEPALRT